MPRWSLPCTATRPDPHHLSSTATRLAPLALCLRSACGRASHFRCRCVPCSVGFACERLRMCSCAQIMESSQTLLHVLKRESVNLTKKKQASS